MKKLDKYKILGVDPGTNLLGYAVIEVVQRKIILVEMGVVTMRKLSSPAEKLKKIFESLERIIKSHRPYEMAIEAPFYGKNVQSMLKLGRAQGVAIAAAMVNEVSVKEYAPKKIKQSVTGKGSASKEQVAAMLENILNIKLDDYGLDATDALATAVCHHFQLGSLLSGQKRYKDWSSYIDQNPSRKG